MHQPPRHKNIAAKRFIYIVQYLDKNTWKDSNTQYYTEEHMAYSAQEKIRVMSPADARFRIRKFEEKE
jgi:hypothetical protein